MGETKAGGEYIVRRGNTQVLANAEGKVIGKVDGTSGEEGAIKFASPAAQAAAQAAGLEDADFDGQTGSGKDGAFTSADVKKVADAKAAGESDTGGEGGEGGESGGSAQE